MKKELGQIVEILQGWQKQGIPIHVIQDDREDIGETVSGVLGKIEASLADIAQALK